RLGSATAPACWSAPVGDSSCAPASPVVASPRVEVRDQGGLQWRGWYSRTRPRGSTAGRGPAEFRATSRGRRPHPSWGDEGKQQEEPGRAHPIGPLDWLKLLPHEAATSSDRLGWVGLQAARCRAAPAFELDVPALTHHRLFLFTRPPDELDLRYEGVRRSVPPPAGSISLMRAGSSARVRSSGCKDELHIFLEPGLGGRVAARAFG